MLFDLGLAFLFFLPVIESFDRQVALSLLLISSVLLSLSSFWKRKLHFDFIDSLWLLTLSVFSIAAVFSWSISRSYIELLRYFAYFLVFISIRNYPHREDLLRKIFIPMVIANALVLSFLFIISPILQFPLPATRMSLYYPIFLGHNHIADILLFAIPLALFMRRKFLSTVLSLFFIVMLVLSVSRGAMLSLTFAFLIYFIATKLFRNSREYPNRRILLLTILTIIFLLSSFIYSNFLIPETNKENALKGFYKPVTAENRLEYLSQTWRRFRQSPIFGTGLDTFRYISPMYQSEKASWSWYTHNHFLQLFAETGFVGGLLFLSLIVILLFNAYKNINPQPTTHNSLQTAIYIAVIASASHSLLDFDWQFISIFLIFFISLGLLNPNKEEKAFKSHNYLAIILFLAIIAMYAIPVILPIDSYKLIAESERYLKKKDYKKAENSLQKAYRLDSKNQEVMLRIADFEAKRESSNSAHFWYKNAILLAPLDSESIIRTDLTLFLTQAKSFLGKKDFRLGYDYITKAAEIYPFSYQLINGDYYVFNAQKLFKDGKTYEARKMLSDYIKAMERQINRKKLSKEEILIIAERLRQNVY